MTENHGSASESGSGDAPQPGAYQPPAPQPGGGPTPPQQPAGYSGPAQPSPPPPAPSDFQGAAPAAGPAFAPQQSAYSDPAQQQSGYQPPAAGYAAQPGQSPQWTQPGYQQQPSSQGFVRSLFDFSFSHFVSITYIKILYIIALVAIGLSYLLLVVSAIQVAASPFSRGGGGIVAFAILGGAIGAALSVVWTRIVLEFIVANIRTAQNTTDLVQRG